MILSSNADVFWDALNYYRTLSVPITILRSSAIYEDLKGDEVFSRRSFSGIFESRINRSERTLANGTKRIWASLFSIPSLNYSLDFGFDPTSNQMAVLVQQMINGSKSGIIFAYNNGRIFI